MSLCQCEQLCKVIFACSWDKPDVPSIAITHNSTLFTCSAIQFVWKFGENDHISTNTAAWAPLWPPPLLLCGGRNGKEHENGEREAGSGVQGKGGTAEETGEGRRERASDEGAEGEVGPNRRRVEQNHREERWAGTAGGVESLQEPNPGDWHLPL